MTTVDINDINIPFDCEDCGTDTTVTPLDLVFSGVPLCELCNKEMSVDSNVSVAI